MYQIDTRLRCASKKTASWWLSLVASGMWLFSFLFVEPSVAQHYSHWGILALLDLPRWLNICVDMGIPTSGCTVRFNPWYKNFISGLRFCENQPPCSWLIVKLLSLLCVNNCKCTNWTLFFVAYIIPLGCYVLFHSQAFSFGNTVWVVFLDKYPWRTRVA